MQNAETVDSGERFIQILAVKSARKLMGQSCQDLCCCEIRENGMELFAAFAGLAPARGGQAVALAWKGLRPDAGCSMRFRARRGGGLSAAAAAVGTLSCCRPVPASGCRYRAAAGDVVSAACGRGSGRVDVVV